MNIPLNPTEIFFGAVFIVLAIVILAELIGEIRWRLYLERRRRETMGAVKRGRRPW